MGALVSSWACSVMAGAFVKLPARMSFMNCSAMNAGRWSVRSAMTDVTTPMPELWFADAAARFAADARGMGFVDHRERSEAVCGIQKFREAQDVSVNAERGVAYDEPAARGSGVFRKFALQVRHVVVRIDDDPCAAQSAAVDDARVVERGAEDYVFLAAQGGPDSDVRLVARGVLHCGFRAFERREVRFERGVRRERACGEPGTARARAVTGERFRRGFFDAGVVCEVEVIVRAEHQDFACVFQFRFCSGGGCE